MKKVFLGIIFLFLWSVSLVKAEDCFFPATFDPLTFTVHLSCVDIGEEVCYTAVLDVEEQGPELNIVLVSVNATDIPLDQLKYLESLPFYNPDNETLIIPALVLGETSYKISLKLVWTGDLISFDLLNIIPVPNISPVCFPDDSSSGNQGPGSENVFSQRVKDSADQLITCYEYKGSSDFISYVSSNLLPVYGENVHVDTAFESCPAGYELGCYMIDEDGNWYAQYKYSHPLSDYLYPLVCPEENGYHYIFP